MTIVGSRTVPGQPGPRPSAPLDGASPVVV